MRFHVVGTHLDKGLLPIQTILIPQTGYLSDSSFECSSLINSIIFPPLSFFIPKHSSFIHLISPLFDSVPPSKPLLPFIGLQYSLLLIKGLFDPKELVVASFHLAVQPAFYSNFRLFF